MLASILAAAVAATLAASISDPTQSNLFRPSSRLIEDFGRAYGYCVVQDAWLDYIYKKHPDLKANTLAARAEFSLAYSGSCAFVEGWLANSAGIDPSVLREQIVTQLRENSAGIFPEGTWWIQPRSAPPDRARLAGQVP